MIELLTAMVAYASNAASGPLTTVLSGGLYAIQAKKNPGYPYGLLTPLAAPAEAGYRQTVVFSENELQLSVYATSAEAAGTAIKAAITVFDADGFVLASGRSKFHTQRTTDPMPVPGSGEKDAESGEYIYGWFVTYRYGITN